MCMDASQMYRDATAGDPYKDMGRSDAIRNALRVYSTYTDDMIVVPAQLTANASSTETGERDGREGVPHPCFEMHVRKEVARVGGARDSNGDPCKLRLPKLSDLARSIRTHWQAENFPEASDMSDEALVAYCTSTGLGADWYWSFCRDSLESESHMWHCRMCGACGSWRQWHCHTCDKCQHGVTMPCGTCRPLDHRKRMAY
jgi:hypothetical protein